MWGAGSGEWSTPASHMSRLALLPLILADAAAARQSLSLDGQWEFKLSVGGQSGTIVVPGSFEAQGFGNETQQMCGS